MVVCLVLVVLATLGSAAWSAYTGLFAESPDVAAASVAVDPTESLQPVVWTLQIIGAFPFRGSPAPMGVYALYLLAVVPFLVAGVRRTAGRERVAVVGRGGADDPAADRADPGDGGRRRGRSGRGATSCRSSSASC